MSESTIEGLPNKATSAANDDLLAIWRAVQGDTAQIEKTDFLGFTATGGGVINTNGKTLTVVDDSTINGNMDGDITGGGLIATGGKTLTVPDDGVASLLALAQTYTALKTFSAGISFGQSTLNFYESGNWEPTIYGSTTAGSPSFTPSSARYERIGRFCFVTGYIALSNKGTMAGNVMFGGLPFVVSGIQSVPIWWPVNLATGIVQLSINLQGGQTHGGLLRSTGAVTAGNTAMPVSDLNNNTHFQFSFGYICQ